MPTIQDWITPAEAARRLSVTPQWVRRLLRQGRLSYLSTPLGRLIDPQGVTRYAAERSARQQSADHGEKTA